MRTLALISAIITTACSNPLGPERDALDLAQARWEASALAAYRFQFQRLCYCGPTVTRPVRIQVLGGEVVAVYDVETDEPAPEPLASFPTIEDLFAEIEDALRREAFRLQASYDEELGYPVEVAIDFLENAVDEEMAFLVSEFEVPPQLLSTPADLIDHRARDRLPPRTGFGPWVALIKTP